VRAVQLGNTAAPSTRAGPHPLLKGKTMSKSFHLTVADNIAALRDWHGRQHLLEWVDCPAEPCNHLEAEFRKVWS
jgi:hypothetical protein